MKKEMPCQKLQKAEHGQYKKRPEIIVFQENKLTFNNMFVFDDHA